MPEQRILDAWNIEELGTVGKHARQNILDGYHVDDKFSDNPDFWLEQGITEAEFNAAQKEFIDQNCGDKVKQI